MINNRLSILIILLLIAGCGKVGKVINKEYNDILSANYCLTAKRFVWESSNIKAEFIDGKLYGSFADETCMPTMLKVISDNGSFILELKYYGTIHIQHDGWDEVFRTDNSETDWVYYPAQNGLPSMVHVHQIRVDGTITGL